jgi:hypothetical protein
MLATFALQLVGLSHVLGIGGNSGLLGQSVPVYLFKHDLCVLFIQLVQLFPYTTDRFRLLEFFTKHIRSNIASETQLVLNCPVKEFVVFSDFGCYTVPLPV